MGQKIRLRRKMRAADEIADFLKAKGKIFDKVEYLSEPHVPVRMEYIREMFGSWGGCLTYLESYRPDAFPTAKVEEASVVTKPAPKAKVAPKAKAKAKVAPKAKPATAVKE